MLTVPCPPCPPASPSRLQRTFDNIEDGFYIAPAFLDKMSIHVAKVGRGSGRGAWGERIFGGGGGPSPLLGQSQPPQRLPVTRAPSAASAGPGGGGPA